MTLKNRHKIISIYSVTSGVYFR